MKQFSSFGFMMGWVIGLYYIFTIFDLTNKTSLTWLVGLIHRDLGVLCKTWVSVILSTLENNPLPVKNQIKICQSQLMRTYIPCPSYNLQNYRYTLLESLNLIFFIPDLKQHFILLWFFLPFGIYLFWS